MKKVAGILFTLNLCIAGVFCSGLDEQSAIEKIKKNPAVQLNIQDVPIFHTDNPLKGLDSFVVLSPSSIQTAEVSRQIKDVLEKELVSIGTVVRASEKEIGKYGAESILNFQIGAVSKWDGGDLPISRVSLNLETSVLVCKTDLKTTPSIWGINSFVNSPFTIQSEEKLVGAIQKLAREFAENYSFVNTEQKNKPTFYIY